MPQSDRDNKRKAEISVLISVYNKTLINEFVDCFESLFAQTLRPEEIILVIDGPVSDELLCAIDKYSNRGILVTKVKLKENVGLGRALNIGLSYCNYDLVARMDSDDLCMPERFEVQIKTILNDPDCAALGSFIKYYDGSKIIGERKVPISEIEIKKSAWLRNPLNHPTVLFQKRKILAIGGYPEVRYSQDYLLWLNCINNGYKICNIPLYLVYMRKGNDFNSRRGLSMLKYDNMPYIYQYRNGMIFMPKLLVAITMRVFYQLFNTLTIKHFKK